MNSTTAAVRWLPVEVRHGHAAVSLVLCATSTPADLLPDLAGAVGAGELNAGVRIEVLGAQTLAWDRSLQAQGVTAGSVLVLTAEPPPPPIQDDVVEAVATLTAASAPTPDQARRTMLAVAAVLVLLGAGSLLPDGTDLGHALAALVTAGALAGATVGLTRSPLPWVSPVLPAGLAVTVGVVALALSPGLPENLTARAVVLALTLTAVGAALLVAPPVRAVGAAAVGLGAAIGSGAGAMALGGARPGEALLVVAVLAAVLTDVAPRLALARRAEPEPVGSWHHRWLAPAAEDLSAAREVWSGLACTRGLLLWAAAWWAPGRAGMVTVVVAALAGHLLALPVAVPAVRIAATMTFVGSVALSLVRVDGASGREPAAVAVMLAAGVAATLTLNDSSRELLRSRLVETIGLTLVAVMVPLTLLALGAARWWSG